MAKYTITFNDKQERTIGRLAKKKEMAKAEILRRCIALYALVEDEADLGCHLELVSDDGTRKKIVL